MKQIKNSEYEEYQKYLRDKNNGRILIPDGLRLICQANDYDAEKIGACEKTKVFSCVLLLIDTTVVIFYKKVYTPPFPIRMLLWNPMRQLRLFSVYCDIYKDCVQ